MRYDLYFIIGCWLNEVVELIKISLFNNLGVFKVIFSVKYFLNDFLYK